MVTDDPIESGSPGNNGSAKSCGNWRIRPVILNLFTRYGAKRILCLGHCNRQLCPAFRDVGAVAGRDPRESDITRTVPLVPANPGEETRFDMVLCTEGDIASLRPAELVELAAGEIQPEGIFILSMPYPGYLKHLPIRARAWWNSHRAPATTDGPTLWSRQRLTALLESHGFTLLECIGIRDRAFRLASILLVARKTDSPEPEKEHRRAWPRSSPPASCPRTTPLPRCT